MTTLLAVVAVAGGGISGYLFFDGQHLQILDSMAHWALLLLLFGIGLDLGRSSGLVRRIKGLGWHMLLVPLTIAVGSITATALAAPFLGLAAREGAAVGAGFGWYSLSAVIITQNYDVGLGAVAFLANVFRELLAIIGTVWVASHLGHVTAVAPGGATTMDVTLPFVAKATSREVTVLAFLSGMILSALVPILVPLLLP